jgi:nephrocystin-3
MTAQELCAKTYGEKHMLMLRLFLNIGILYEDNRNFETAYDYFIKWHDTCIEVWILVMYILTLFILDSSISF